jgi:hypothetical protein
MPVGIVLFAAILCWMNRRDRRRLAAGCATVAAMLLLHPPQAQAQGLLSEVDVVLRTINSMIGGLLNTIHSVQSDLRSVQQAVIWPQTAITQARSYATNWVNTYQHPMQLLFEYTPASATLPQVRALEHTITDRIGSDLPQLDTGYRQIYGAVPVDNRMSPADKNLTDLDDALSLDVLQQLKRGDQVNASVRAAGDQLETMATSAAPGTAPFVTASALVTMLGSQAATQKMLAAYLRLESARLAHQTAEVKGFIAAANSLQQSVTKILSTQ